jgi:hypothetical protein
MPDPYRGAEMNLIRIVALAGILNCTGCTTLSLEYYTQNQSRSCGECRDNMVANCLATIAADPDTMPSYSLFTYGLTTVTDTVNLSETTTFAPQKFTLDTLGVTGSRAPKGQWTVDPSAEWERIAALHAACLWVLYGPERANAAHPGILGDPQVYLDQKPHFAVESRLAKIPPGWIHVGKLKDVPACALYKAHRGKTWVWVLPECAEAFAQFTLVLQDIATLDSNVFYNPPLLIALTENEISKLPDVSDKTKAVTIATSQIRAVKVNRKAEVEAAIQESLRTGKTVNLSRAQWLEYTEPWFGTRNYTAAAPAPSIAGRATPTQLSPVNPGLPTIPGRNQAPLSTFSIQ